MSSAIGFPNPDLAPRLHNGLPVVCISKHAVDRVEDRSFPLRPPGQSSEEFIQTVIKYGVPWHSPSGPAVRYGLTVAGYEKVPGGVVITTVYNLISPHAVRQYYRRVIGKEREKPGRRKAWENVRHQGKYCKHPPAIPTPRPRS